MNSTFHLIVGCFIINLINVFNVFSVKADIIFLEAGGTASEKFKWVDGQINFKIAKSFNEGEIALILAAMYAIEKSSCIRFAPHDSRQGRGRDYVMIKKDYIKGMNGFESDLGCSHQGEQLLFLAAEHMREFQMILHELLHVIGIDYHGHRFKAKKRLSDYDESLLNRYYGCDTVHKKKRRHEKEYQYILKYLRYLQHAKDYELQD